MLLTPMANGPSNFLEESIKSLFEKEDVARNRQRIDPGRDDPDDVTAQK
jgi:hypothetical protein